MLSKKIQILASSITGSSILPGEMYSFTNSARGGRTPETIDVVIVSLQSKGRWRCYDPTFTHSTEGKWTIPERMLQKATKRYTEAQKAKIYAQGKEAWDERDALKTERKEQRKERVQQTYDTINTKYDTKLDKNVTYYWSGGNITGRVQGTWSGEIKDGKAKMFPYDPGMLDWGSNRPITTKRAVWVLLDRLFYEVHGTMYRVVSAY